MVHQVTLFTSGAALQDGPGYEAIATAGTTDADLANRRKKNTFFETEQMCCFGIGMA